MFPFIDDKFFILVFYACLIFFERKFETGIDVSFLQDVKMNHYVD